MPNESAAMLTRKCAILCLLWPLLCAGLVLASESCFYCRGINCQRTSYQATEHCAGEVDTCVSIFQSGMVQAQGCFESLEYTWREYCGGAHSIRTQCEVCVTEKCNNATSRELSCLQCQDTEVCAEHFIKYPTESIHIFPLPFAGRTLSQCTARTDSSDLWNRSQWTQLLLCSRRRGAGGAGLLSDLDRATLLPGGFELSAL